ncbi:MAG: hypothetical protein COB02_10890 [Candidatus Cloacimonadota bacterium]|nr:MAG: hypothetical protein COB02_10890 [Candidatus Cloacimonadota bacterium]
MTYILKTWLLLSICLSFTNASSSHYQIREVISERFNHRLFDVILNKNVSQGKVDYQSIKKSPQKLLKYLAKIAKADLSSFSRNQKLAFYINAYNAYTIKAVIDHYPIKVTTRKAPTNSIRQISGVWDRLRFKVAGKKLTLNDIEHKYVRKFKDGRVHLAMVCGAVSCPDLPNFAFEANKLDAQLDSRVSLFMKQVHKFHFCADCSDLKISKIFEWFPNDFRKFAKKRTRKYGKMSGVIEFFIQYMSEKAKKNLLKRQPRIQFLPYDWKLNDQ